MRGLMSKKITATVEKYLKGIYRLQERNGFAKTSDLIKMFNVSPGTITNTIKRFKKLKKAWSSIRDKKLTEDLRDLGKIVGFEVMEV